MTTPDPQDTSDPTAEAVEELMFAHVEFAAEVSRVYADLEQLYKTGMSLETVLNLCQGFYLYGFSVGIDHTLVTLATDVDETDQQE